MNIARRQRQCKGKEDKIRTIVLLPFCGATGKSNPAAGLAASWLAQWPLAQPEDWIPRVNTAETEAELEALRRASQSVRGFGSWCA
jgi:hypothetical protein